MTDKPDGGPVFPSEQGQTPDGAWNQTYCQGMCLRDYYAAHAPVDYLAAMAVHGGRPNLNNDQERAAFFAVWALMRYEYADAMIAEAHGNGR
ncbi:hypothetical protein [Chelatococcus asaccharovorans]|uniref:Uncharacterized protein n=1 Tax=Chelatococcus asaccharovorans TaxID=28210 RepID=A0A2V3UAV6_9HYPH|nr:hypothetical protein [Chelatococcus asaccharovorans]MBS7703283.1 hypothetical protein [Chelatococcus asaccharovorans]PXW61615.1 hypothetical protein C7450_103132 [Chelatococcus asaccharovorans]